MQSSNDEPLGSPLSGTLESDSDGVHHNNELDLANENQSADVDAAPHEQPPECASQMIREKANEETDVFAYVKHSKHAFTCMYDRRALHLHHSQLLRKHMHVHVHMYMCK